MIVTLPTPPSTNALFFNRKDTVHSALRGKGQGRRGRGRTEEYDKWRNDAGWLLKAAKPDRFSVPVFVTLEAEENPKRDLDGYLKPILDLLVEYQVIPDDRNRYVRELRASWSKSIEGCRVTVMPWVEYL